MRAIPAVQHLEIPIEDSEWLLQNHRVHYQEAGRRRKSIRARAGWQAKTELLPVNGPVAIYARARLKKGTLPDPDAIAPMMKAIIDGIVDAGIIPDDSGKHVGLVGYGRPERDRTMVHKRTINITVTNQHVPF